MKLVSQMRIWQLSRNAGSGTRNYYIFLLGNASGHIVGRN